MSRKRLDNLDPQRQRILFDAAAAEFAAKGFDAASLNRILEHSGMSKSSLYYYFEDKADLFTTLMERTLSAMFTQVGGFDPQALTAQTYWSELERLYGKTLAVAGEHPWIMQFGGMVHGLRADPKRAASTGRLFRTARQWVGVLLARGQALGVVRSDLPDSLCIDVTMGLFEALDRWVVTHWPELTAEEREALPAAHMGLFLDVLSPRGERQGQPQVNGPV